ncbi:hypothetical protein K2Y11_14095 [bacterium]|nr:hypothetical protein [bacterium]
MSGLVLTIGAGGVPAGAYTARFVSVEPTPADPQKGYGPGLKWTWEVIAGAQAGQKTSRTTTATPSPKNAAGKIISGLLGRPLQTGENIDTGGLIGRPYLIVVAEGQTGTTRVESVTVAATN